MKVKLLIIFILLSVSVFAGTQVTQEGQQQKVFISVGNKHGSDETNAKCFATITDSQYTQVLDQSPMYYEGGSLYYFLTNKNWEEGSYTASFTCTSIDGTKSGVMPFIIDYLLDSLNEESTLEQKETWFEKLIKLVPEKWRNALLIFKNVFATMLEAVLFIPKFFITLFHLFIWVIKNIWIIIMLFEVYVLSVAISKESLMEQISTVVQKNVFAIEFIVTISLRILTFAVRTLTGILTTITNLVPFT